MLNCAYHIKIFYKKNINLCSKYKSLDKSLVKLQELITICHKNIYHTQKCQQQANNKGVKCINYALDNKV